jgi:hypothetical protein
MLDFWVGLVFCFELDFLGGIRFKNQDPYLIHKLLCVKNYSSYLSSVLIGSDGSSGL